MASQSSINNTIPNANFTVPNGQIYVGSTAPSNPYNISIEGTVAGNIGLSIQNLSANPAASAISQYIVEAGAQDAYSAYFVNGAGQWSVGLDNSDSDNFKITTGVSPSAGTEVFKSTSAGIITFNNSTTVTTGNLTLSNGIIFGSKIGSVNGNMQLTNTGAAATDAANIWLLKDRTGGIITSGDILGRLQIYGHDGTSPVLSSEIRSTSSGTIAASRVASTLSFWTHPDSITSVTQRMTIASTGEVTVAVPDSGTGLTATGTGSSDAANFIVTDATAVNLKIDNTQAGNSSGKIRFRKNRSGGVITSGDNLGNLNFYGFDGSNYIEGARILATNSGTVAANRIASNLQFWTHPDSAGGITQRMTIAPTGEVTIAAPDSGVGLTISGGGLTLTTGNEIITSGTLSVTASSGDAVTSNVSAVSDVNYAGINSISGAQGARIDLKKNRSGGVLTSGDTLGSYRYFGYDGSAYLQCSEVKSVSSGTIAANRIASNLEFWTHPDSVTVTTQRMVIASTGAVTINAPDSGTGLTISGGGSSTTGRADFANGISFDAGTNTVSTYTASTSWTPVLAFGGGSTGITYSTQTGQYTRIGTLGVFSCAIVLTNKGSSTGSATITGLPIAPHASSGGAAYSMRFSNLTYDGQVFARSAASSGTINLDVAATAGAVTALTDTAFANNTLFLITGCFPI